MFNYYYYYYFIKSYGKVEKMSISIARRPLQGGSNSTNFLKLIMPWNLQAHWKKSLNEASTMLLFLEISFQLCLLITQRRNLTGLSVDPLVLP